LALGSIKNVVAIAKIIEVDARSSKQTIHGAPLGEENERVSIIRAVVAEAKLPFPIKDEIMTVEDAIGACIAWPKKLIVRTKSAAPTKVK
jgi:hypothetical protein